MLTLSNVQILQDLHFIFVNRVFLKKSVETLNVNRRLVLNKLAYICFRIKIVGITVRIELLFSLFLTVCGTLFARSDAIHD